MNFNQKYGQVALVAGASEGIGAEFSRQLASKGIDLILIARKIEALETLAQLIREQYKVNVQCFSCDLSAAESPLIIKELLKDTPVDILVYNAALSHIGRFENNTIDGHKQIAQVNMITPMSLMHLFGEPMLRKGKGAIILMSSMAGFQGSGFLSVYAASKAFNRILAESVWYEWKHRGVDIIACCAGATSTPNFIKTNPGKQGIFAPRIQTPDEVVEECLRKLGKCPSITTGFGNKLAGFIMQRLLPRKLAINIMGDTTREMYKL